MKKISPPAGTVTNMDQNYLFIDGGYLDQVYERLFVPVFGNKYSIECHFVMQAYGVRRAYYYHCLDDVQRGNEKQADFEARVKAQEERFDEIDRTPGLHVRLGWLSPGKKRNQKEVDVLLAVEMLTYSFSKTITKAVLLTGDRDFKPAVESMVRLDTYVEIAYDPATGSKEFARTADKEHIIDISTLCQWMKLDDPNQRHNHFPLEHFQGSKGCPILQIHPSAYLVRSGRIGKESRTWNFYSHSSGVHYYSVFMKPQSYYVCKFHDEGVLTKYVEAKWGEIH